jgi:hypothetical protein
MVSRLNQGYNSHTEAVTKQQTFEIINFLFFLYFFSFFWSNIFLEILKMDKNKCPKSNFQKKF